MAERETGDFTRRACEKARRRGQAFFYPGIISQAPPPRVQPGARINTTGVRAACYYNYFPHRNICGPSGVDHCDPEVHDPGGFNFWVDKLNSQYPTFGDGAYNEMLRAFITSIEYRTRFGP